MESPNRINNEHDYKFQMLYVVHILLDIKLIHILLNHYILNKNQLEQLEFAKAA